MSDNRKVNRPCNVLTVVCCLIRLLSERWGITLIWPHPSPLQQVEKVSPSLEASPVEGEEYAGEDWGSTGKNVRRGDWFGTSCLAMTGGSRERNMRERELMSKERRLLRDFVPRNDEWGRGRGLERRGNSRRGEDSRLRGTSYQSSRKCHNFVTFCHPVL